MRLKSAGSSVVGVEAVAASMTIHTVRFEPSRSRSLHGEDPSAYRIGRRVGDPRRGPARAITLLGGATSDVRVDLVHLAPREAGAPIERQDGDGIVAVSRGLVQIKVGDETPAIRDGEVLLADCARVRGWRNLGDREAVLFWIAIAPRA